MRTGSIPYPLRPVFWPHGPSRDQTERITSD